MLLEQLRSLGRVWQVKPLANGLTTSQLLIPINDY
jgi:hypothetical protein